MINLKSCLPKGNLLDATIVLISISFIEIGLLYFWNSYSQLQCHQILEFFYQFLYGFNSFS